MTEWFILAAAVATVLVVVAYHHRTYRALLDVIDEKNRALEAQARIITAQHETVTAHEDTIRYQADTISHQKRELDIFRGTPPPRPPYTDRDQDSGIDPASLDRPYTNQEIDAMRSGAIFSDRPRAQLCTCTVNTDTRKLQAINPDCPIHTMTSRTEREGEEGLR